MSRIFHTILMLVSFVMICSGCLSESDNEKQLNPSELAALVKVNQDCVTDADCCLFFGSDGDYCESRSFFPYNCRISRQVKGNISEEGYLNELRRNSHLFIVSGSDLGAITAKCSGAKERKCYYEATSCFARD